MNSFCFTSLLSPCVYLVSAPVCLMWSLQVSYYFPHKVMWRAFFAALTAAFTLQLMNPYFSGHLVLFYANYNHEWHLFEFLPFIVIGVFGVSESVRWYRVGACEYNGGICGVCVGIGWMCVSIMAVYTCTCMWGE